MNNIVIQGKLVGEIKSATSEKGTKRVNFSVMDSRQIGDEWQREFYPVACFGDLATAVEQQLQAKDRIVVIGSVQQNVWDGDDGKEKRHTYIYAREIAVPVRHLQVMLEEGDDDDGFDS